MPPSVAELAGEEVDPERLQREVAHARDRAAALVVEGVGGLLVPLTRTYIVRDFVRDTGLPLIVAAAPGLGTINHTLLTLEAARAGGLEVAAEVLTPWPARPERNHESNRETIESLGEVPVLTLAEVDLARQESWPVLELEIPR